MALSRPGRIGVALPPSDVLAVGDGPPAALLRDDLRLPELSQLDVVRHFTRLSQLNWSIDTTMYPLGSCTMKLNPKVNDAVAALPGFAEAHPMQPAADVQGALAVMHGLQQQLAEITGMAGASLAPMAGAQGELAGIRVIQAYLDARASRDERRTRVLVPDSAHGTNPATASMAGFDVVAVRSRPDGDMDLDALREALESHGHAVAALMITLPSTLGLFDRNIVQIARLVHEHGAQVYGDGANLNAMLGQVKPGDLGFDVMHINLHKTFSQPHGGGGPGAGPIAVKEHLRPYLPAPVVVVVDDEPSHVGSEGRLPEELRSHDSIPAGSILDPPRSGAPSTYRLADPPRTIGRMGAFHGNFGVLVRAYAYIRSLGADGLRAISEAAVLNANYVQARLRDAYELAHDRTPMHEVLFSGNRQKAESGVKTIDIAKRMIDYGFHPPTIYFPLVVEEAMMVEPTESETKETLDAFCDAMLRIAGEASDAPELLRSAPHTAPLRRLDEATAARQPRLRW
ncbi:MAG: aminomethyl-transferring glycine dehydrogenase subunit GcvPB [Dehalococcoidia bacterium]|nr:aminomethyl-transferring glycine dehydrogenase subunit GcvPB [Dehalococcoidia bacterium]